MYFETNGTPYVYSQPNEVIVLHTVPNKGFIYSSSLLCWLNAALQLLMLTPINKFLCGMFSLDHTLSTMLRYTKKTFDFNSNGVHEYYAIHQNKSS